MLSTSTVCYQQQQMSRQTLQALSAVPRPRLVQGDQWVQRRKSDIPRAAQEFNYQHWLIQVSSSAWNLCIIFSLFLYNFIQLIGFTSLLRRRPSRGGSVRRIKDRRGMFNITFPPLQCLIRHRRLVLLISHCQTLLFKLSRKECRIERKRSHCRREEGEKKSKIIKSINSSSSRGYWIKKKYKKQSDTVW